MAKGKGKKKGKRVGTKRAVGAGMLGGVATLVATKGAGEVVKEAVKLGAGHIIGLRQGPPALEKDLGYKLLKLLAKRGGPVRLACLPGELQCGLLPLLEAVQSLRRVRLLKLTDGRRTVLLTALGRESLDVLVPKPKEKDDDRRNDDEETDEEIDLLPVASDAEAKVTSEADADDSE